MKVYQQDSEVHFGEVFREEVDWRGQIDDDDPDDELLDETPEDVVKMLGFDPLE